MKKVVLALTAVVAMTGVASAADLAARPYTKAPVVAAPLPSWTGCYLGAGGGAAMTNNDNNLFDPLTGLALTNNATSGARGWFGTVQGGCDYQFQNWVVGAFADYDFMDVHGDLAPSGLGGFVGSQKQDWQWAVGARVGYLILPQLLTYVSGGYTQAHWKDTDLSFPIAGFGSTFTVPGGTKGGWFIGAGDEYALTSFVPGLFWKTEYRYSEFDRVNVPVNFSAAVGGGATGVSMTEKFREHSVRSELVYRFNWGGPVVAKY